MWNEPTLFDDDVDDVQLQRVRARARRTDPDTSHAAAKSLSSDRLRVSQAAVAEALRLLGGSGTDEQIADAYLVNDLAPQQSPSGLRTRRAELVAAGRVADSGERVRLRSGRAAIVWRLT